MRSYPAPSRKSLSNFRLSQRVRCTRPESDSATRIMCRHKSVFVPTNCFVTKGGGQARRGLEFLRFCPVCGRSRSYGTRCAYVFFPCTQHGRIEDMPKARADDVACRYANLLELKRKTEGRNGMFLTLEDSLRKWYLSVAVCGHRMTRRKEADLGTFQLDGQTAGQLTGNNIGVFVGSSPDMDYIMDRRNGFAQSRFRILRLRNRLAR
jgi:hypothetical protein